MAFARLFFPTEAKLAMDIAHAETTSEFAGLHSSNGSSGKLRREVDLNETPFMEKKRLTSRMQALVKTGNFHVFLLNEYIQQVVGKSLADATQVQKEFSSPKCMIEQ